MSIDDVFLHNATINVVGATGSYDDFLDPSAVNQNFSTLEMALRDHKNAITELETLTKQLKNVLGWVEATHPEVLDRYRAAKAAALRILDGEELPGKECEFCKGKGRV